MIALCANQWKEIGIGKRKKISNNFAFGLIDFY